MTSTSQHEAFDAQGKVNTFSLRAPTKPPSSEDVNSLLGLSAIQVRSICERYRGHRPNITVRCETSQQDSIATYIIIGLTIDQCCEEMARCNSLSLVIAPITHGATRQTPSLPFPSPHSAKRSVTDQLDSQSNLSASSTELTDLSACSSYSDGNRYCKLVDFLEIECTCLKCWDHFEAKTARNWTLRRIQGEPVFTAHKTTKVPVSLLCESVQKWIHNHPDIIIRGIVRTHEQQTYYMQHRRSNSDSDTQSPTDNISSVVRTSSAVNNVPPLALDHAPSTQSSIPSAQSKDVKDFDGVQDSDIHQQSAIKESDTNPEAPTRISCYCDTDRSGECVADAHSALVPDIVDVTNNSKIGSIPVTPAVDQIDALTTIEAGNTSDKRRKARKQDKAEKKATSMKPSVAASNQAASSLKLPMSKRRSLDKMSPIVKTSKSEHHPFSLLDDKYHDSILKQLTSDESKTRYLQQVNICNTLKLDGSISEDRSVPNLSSSSSSPCTSPTPDSDAAAGRPVTDLLVLDSEAATSRPITKLPVQYNGTPCYYVPPPPSDSEGSFERAPHISKSPLTDPAPSASYRPPDAFDDQWYRKQGIVPRAPDAHLVRPEGGRPEGGLSTWTTTLIRSLTGGRGS